MKPHILLVDDDPALLKLLSLRLCASGYQVSTADSGKAALAQLNDQISLVLTDLRMDGMDGMALFQAFQQQAPQLPVIIMTAHGSIPEAVDATQQGVAGFLTKPIDKQQLLSTLEQALAGQQQQQPDWRSAIIGRSPLLEQLLQQAQRVAKADVSVLISGASGTGKELLAQAIHKASQRQYRPFIAINCGALPEQLLESELFGHSKGAFTGAVQKHQGLFQAAEGGTLFLDEIGDMPQSLQVKLLRALQERMIRPVGSTESIAINVRVISASHQNLESMMADNSFREDLYYRLNVVNLRLPSLQERPEDIPLLARYFLNRAANRHNPKVRSISAGGLSLLAQASWPGNIRQLENVIEQLTALSNSSVISEGSISQTLACQTPALPTFNDARADFERRYLSKVLQITEGNVTQAARIAGRNRTDLYKLLGKHSLEATQFKP